MIHRNKRFFKINNDSARVFPLVHVALYGVNNIKHCVLDIMFSTKPVLWVK